MYNRTKFIVSLAIFALTVFSCGYFDKPDSSTKEKTTSQEDKKESGENSGNEKKETGQSDKKENDTKSSKLDLQWDFRPLKPGKYDEPMTNVYLIVNGNSNFVSKIYYSFSETPKEGYKDYDIPSDALASCRGWWAGAGIDYWVIKKDNELIVMGRDIGETTDENGEAGDFVGKPVVISKIKIDQ